MLVMVRFLNKGIEKFWVVVNQKRQFPKGITSFVTEYDGVLKEKLRSAALELLKKTNYSGFAEAEFKVDEGNNKVYLIEVNPRPWGWIKATKKRLVFPNFAPYNDFKINWDEPVVWVNLLRDVAAIMQRIKNIRSNFNFKDLLLDYLSFPSTDVLELTDPIPFFKQIVQFLR